MLKRFISLLLLLLLLPCAAAQETDGFLSGLVGMLDR